MVVDMAIPQGHWRLIAESWGPFLLLSGFAVAASVILFRRLKSRILRTAVILLGLLGLVLLAKVTIFSGMVLFETL